MKGNKIAPNKNRNKWFSNQVFSTAFLCLFLLAGCGEELKILDTSGKSKQDKLKDAAEQVLRQSLTDADPQIRARAAEVAAVTNQKMLLPQVQKLLTDEYVPVRFAAAVAIGDMEYHLAKKTLLRLIETDEDNTRLGAAYALYKLGYKQYIELIRKAVLSNDQTVRANAVVLLGKSGNTDSLKLLYWAKDDDYSEPKVRYQAAEAIARLGDEKIVPKLWTMIISKFVDNKIIGIRAMGALGTKEAKEILLTRLDDDILEVRLIIAEQLGLLGDASGQDKVVSVFKENLTYGMDREGYERVMVLTAIAIGRIDTPAVTKYLPKLLEDESRQVQLAAAGAVLLSKTVR